jgi:aerobic-type carbon monoxide dehydrogenase small subunit (CoxS/CutS family)
LKTTITLHVNGDAHELSVEPNRTLLDVLREELALTGTKKGCDLGACGACTVIADGEPILSCMTLAVRCQSKEITTIEGLAQKGELHPLQNAAIEHDAVQCGFCTPGWLLSAKVLLENKQSRSYAGGGTYCDCGQHLSLYRIQEDRGCHSGCNWSE